jgi:hypothetical protein
MKSSVLMSASGGVAERSVAAPAGEQCSDVVSVDIEELEQEDRRVGGRTAHDAEQQVIDADRRLVLALRLAMSPAQRQLGSVGHPAPSAAMTTDRGGSRQGGVDPDGLECLSVEAYEAGSQVVDPDAEEASARRGAGHAEEQVLRADVAIASTPSFVSRRAQHGGEGLGRQSCRCHHVLLCFL